MEKCAGSYFLYNGKVEDKSKFDGGFDYKGKCLYEVIRIIDGIPLFLDGHIHRFENSFKIENLKLPVTEHKIEENIFELVKANNKKIGNIKLVFNYVDNKFDFYSYFIPHKYPDKSDYENGVKTIIYHGERSNPNAKVINLDFRSSVDKKIKEMNVFEAILVDRNGNITEGSKSNIFMVKDNKVYTAPKEDVLPGITRDVIIKVCKNCGLEVLDKRINYKDINKLDGLFISGTSPKVLPICEVDEMKFDSQKVQTIKRIRKGYDEYIEKYIRDFNSRNQKNNIQ
ncbi:MULTISPECIES: aminotransferase class IV [Clostridium]|uniref:aminotransferase class IV n=1 Tax=Clostridium TaxID=1485 RepID=UPI000825CDAB|nr:MULTISPECIES: aminotransferase class IV [Clostridium]PJI09809.1 aminotransferase class IV [Clostridium sp. CT7]